MSPLSKYATRNKVLILGNGFDVDLGMKSRYSDFAKSKIWADNIENNFSHLMHEGLLKVLKDAKARSNWFDIEQTMMDFVRRMQSIKQSGRYALDEERDRAEYKLVCKCLKDYLREESKSFNINQKSTAYLAYKVLIDKGGFNKVYSFNYTDINDIANRVGVTNKPEIIHVHGSLLPNDDIILGVEGGDIIPEEYKFMYKTSSKFYHSNNLYQDLLQADEVVFFGHSINGMDFEYFRSFFQIQSDNSIEGYKRKYIRIFTYDNESAMDIKYNLQCNGIDLIALYNLNDLDFIRTKDVESGEEYDSGLFSQFFKDITEMNEPKIHFQNL